MKNMKLIVPVLCAALLAFYAIGCGSNATGGGGGGGGGGTTFGFKVVDPAVIGAQFFMDTNFSGSFDAGEITSDASGTDGTVTFSTLPTIDANILPWAGHLGVHVGASYEGFVARYFSTLETTGIQYITPATSLMTKVGGTFRFTPAQVAYIMTKEAGIDVSADDVISDPMEGIETLMADTVTDNALRRIRGSICLYSFISVMNSVDAGCKDKISFEGFINSGVASVELKAMGDMVKGNLSAALIISINTSIESGSGGGPTPPKVSAGDIARTSVVITNRVIKNVILSAPTFDAIPSQESIMDWAGQLGIRFYCKRTKDNQMISYSLKHQIPPGQSSPPPPIVDSRGVTIEYWEVDTCEAWKIDDTWQIKRIPQ